MTYKMVVYYYLYLINKEKAKRKKCQSNEIQDSIKNHVFIKSEF